MTRLKAIRAGVWVYKNINGWAVVVAQLVERSLLIPEVRGSIAVIGKNLFLLINF